MYTLINKNIKAILAVLAATRFKKPKYHVAEYSSLLANLVPCPPDYNMLYSRYWGISPITLPVASHKPYFRLLHAAGPHRPIPYAPALMAFYPVSGRIEASFISKLCHMWTPNAPIVDRYIRSAFCFGPPLGTSAVPAAVRAAEHTAFLRFLQAEYTRVLTAGTLAPSIAAFRAAFPLYVVAFTDEKIVDSLIWGLSKTIPLGAGPLAGPVTIYPFRPVTRGMTLQQVDKAFRKLKKQLEQLRANGMQVGKIVLRHDPNGVSIPPWFEDWCRVNNIEIAFVDNDIDIEVTPAEIEVPDWMRTAIE